MAGLKKQFFSSKQSKHEPSEHQSRSMFHTSMPDTFKSQLEGVQHYSTTYLDALDLLCSSAAKLAETFVGALRDTPFWEASVQLQQISHDISSATKSVSLQVREDAVALVTSMIKDGENPTRNDENVQVVAKCFLCMLQTQIQFFSTAMGLMDPLSKYSDIIDIIQEYEDNPTMKEACHSWLAASQNTSILRHGQNLTSDEVQLLVVNQDNRDPEPKVIEVKSNYDAYLQRYKYELSRIPSQEQSLIGAFKLYPQCLTLVLKGCCNDNEIEAAGSQSNPLTQQLLHKLYKSRSHGFSKEDWKAHIKKEIGFVAVQADAFLSRAITSKEEATESFSAKLDTISRIVQTTAHQAGLDIPVEDIALCVLSEMCPSVSHTASQIATQILYARANLVSIERAHLEGDLQRYAQVSVNGAVIITEIPTLWWLVEELHAESNCNETHDRIASVEVVYTAKIDLTAWSEGRSQNLPTITVKLCKNTTDMQTKAFAKRPKGISLPKGITECTSTQTSSAAGQPHSSPESPTSGLKKTFTKLTSKFGRKSTPTSSPTRKIANYHVEQSKEGGVSSSANQCRPGDIGCQSEYSSEGKPDAVERDQNTGNMPISEWSVKSNDLQPPKVSTGNPTVTLTTDPNSQDWKVDNTPGIIGNPYPASKENAKKSKHWKASDNQVQDVIDLLSGPARPKSNTGHIGSSPGMWHTIDGGKYDNYNPGFSESDTIDRSTGSSAASWSTGTDSSGAKGAMTLGAYPGYDPDFIKYLETNIPGRRGRGHRGHSHYSNISQVGMIAPMPTIDAGLNRSWPMPEHINESSDVLTSTGMSWSAGQDSGSSSDDSSSNNGENVFSMGLGLAGPDLVAAVNRRRHSSGGEHDNEDDHMKYLDVMMESKSTKTWPPKIFCQRSPSKSPPPPQFTNQNVHLMPHDHLGIHPSLAAQWSDPLNRSSVWSNTPTSSQVATTSPSPLTFGHGVTNPASRNHPKLDRRHAVNMHNFPS
ncbi:granule associated Rac and RHOG effector protein 1-like isoform X2 [Glandiceps talaboti]